MNLIVIGKILSTHGLLGNVKLESFCEEPNDIFSKNLFLKNGESFNCKQVGKTSNTNVFLAKFDKLNSIDEAKEYKNVEVYIKKEDLEELSDGEYYVNDIIDKKVISENRRGKVVNFYNYGAGNSIEIEWENGKLESVPFNNDYIKKVNDDYIEINLPTYI